MRIAIISYEYPPSKIMGGIGTYSRTIATTVAHEHDVEVFAFGEHEMTSLEDGVVVNRIPCPNRRNFKNVVMKSFRSSHERALFDIAEFPEVCAEGLMIQRQFPSLPTVVRCHTPNFVLEQLNYTPPTLGQRLRVLWGGLKHGKINRIGVPATDLEANASEKETCQRATLCLSPSISLARWIEKEWEIPKVDVFPYLSKELPAPDLKQEIDTKRVVYIGRMEPRKGLIELSRAMPRVFKKHPDATFVFVGPKGISHEFDMSYEEWFHRQFPTHRSQIVFTGELSPEGVSEEISQAALVVLPSRWENFPNTCLESMAAGKAVVGSKNGGMSEMIVDGVTGYSVNPKSSRKLAARICSLLGNPGKAREMGAKARTRFESEYTIPVLAKKHINLYKQVIRKHNDT